MCIFLRNKYKVHKALIGSRFLGHYFFFLISVNEPSIRLKAGCPRLAEEPYVGTRPTMTSWVLQRREPRAETKPSGSDK